MLLGVGACGHPTGEEYGDGRVERPAAATTAATASTAPSAATAPASPTSTAEQLRGTWAVETYRSADGVIQSFDTSDPATCITYKFDGSKLVIDWAGQGKDVAPYEWQPDGAGITVVAHFPKSDSGKIRTSQAGDVSYDVTLGDTGTATMQLTVRGTGEQFSLHRVG